MSFFKWKDSFCIGVDEIDQQHRKFSDYLNACYQAVNSDTKSAKLPVLISKLNEYALNHFSFEEDLMKAYGYPELDHHIRQHAFFVNQISRLQDAKNSNADKAMEEAFAFMRDWFLNHILEEDKKLAAHMK